MDDCLQSSKGNIEKICQNECMGCLACFNICPQKAISVIQDLEGFYRPEVNSELCVNCGVCLHTCPITRKVLPNNAYPDAYAIKNKDEGQRFASSSGGFFSLLVQYVLNQNGLVFGVRFDDEFKVTHDSFSHAEILDKYQGSKYAQSFIGDNYRKCRLELERGRIVLFTGTPCQIAGLLSYLGRDYETLITADTICHGVPSPQIWQNYIRYREAQFGSRISSVNFRNKRTGWEQYSLTMSFEDQREYSSINDIDCFMNMFLDNVILRESCYDCRFKTVNRVSDFTMADFWGVQDVMPSMYDDKGTSLVFVHSDKVKKILRELGDAMSSAMLSRKEADRAIAINSSMVKSARRPKERRRLKELIANNDCFFTYNSSARTTAGIINHAFSNNNYGALLVAFAMEKIVQEYGYNPVTVCLDLDRNYSAEFQEFRRKYLHTTKPLRQSQLKALNKRINTFIVGSDQVWRNWWSDYGILSVFFASFADKTKNIISYAASFGISSFNEKAIDKARIRNLLSSFSSISVRELSGVEILRKDFNTYSEYVLDPTLLIDKSYYLQIIKDSSLRIDGQKYITTMIFPGESSDRPECHQAIKTVASDLNASVRAIFQNEKQLSIPDWLLLMSNSYLNIIDSFHGLVFSIIFKINFVCITNAEGGNERFVSLLSACGLEDKLVDCEDIDARVLKEKVAIRIDWDAVDMRLSNYRDNSRRFIQDALNKRIQYNSKVYYQCSIREIPGTMKRALYRCARLGLNAAKKILKG